MPKLWKEAKAAFGPLGLAYILIALSAWMLILVVAPQLIMLDFSLHDMGAPDTGWTLHNYMTLFGNSLHRVIFIKTVWSSLLVTASALVICYPISYYLAKVAKGATLGLLMTCLIIPYWINELLRLFAWQIILADSGILNQALLWLGLISEPFNFRAGNGAVIVGMAYAYVLFMVFPMYNALESLDRNQVDAARDLGASWSRIHRRIIIPHAKPGIAIGCIMTFMLAAGTIAAPQLLGSPSSFWFTELIYTNFETANWNQGAAYAMILAVLCLVFVFFMLKVFKVSLKELSR